MARIMKGKKNGVTIIPVIFESQPPFAKSSKAQNCIIYQPLWPMHCQTLEH